MLESGSVPPVLTIRVLGMLIQHNTQNTMALTKLQKTAKQIGGRLRRGTNRHRGMKEMDLCRLIQAFLISRIVYSFPYYHLRKSDKDKIEAIIQQAYKWALGLPVYTSTEKLLQLGMHNTLEELIEAHKTAQITRLSDTMTGLHILHKLKIQPIHTTGGRAPLPPAIRHYLQIKPTPQNTLAGRHDTRRKASADRLSEKH